MKSRLRSFPRWVSRQTHLNFFRTTGSRRSRRNSNRGFSIVAMLLLAVTLTGMVTAYILLSNYKQIGIASSSDSTTGFYAAETGLNMRSRELIQSFRNRTLPTGTSPNPPSACLGTGGSTGTGDFACVNYTFNGSGSGSQRVAYTYLTDTTEYRNGSVVMKRIPPDEPFGGLNAQEYSYKLNSIANKIVGSRSQTEANLEMDLKSRIVPMFQFGAFYDGDLEYLPGANSTFNGRIHSNGNMYLGSGGTLTVTQQVTVVGQRDANGNLGTSAGLFNSRKDGSRSTYADGVVRINNGSGTAVNLLAGGTCASLPCTPAQTQNPMNNNYLATNFSGQVVVPTSRLQMPYPTGTTGSTYLGTGSNFFTRADLRITYNPQDSLETPRFAVTQVTQSATPTTTNLSRSLLLSMRQPVLVAPAMSTALDNLRTSWRTPFLPLSTPPNPPTAALDATPPGFCRIDTSVPASSSSITSLSTANKQALVDALYLAILAQPANGAPVSFSDLNTALNSGTNNAAGGLRTRYMQTSQGAQNATATSNHFAPRRLGRVLTTTEWNALSTFTPNQIAGLTNQCFISAPIQELTGTTGNTQAFRNRRENRTISLLQLNWTAMSVWNRDGRFLTFNSGSNTYSDDNGGQGTQVTTPLFAVAAADNAAPANTLQRLGYAASDATDGGLVIHASVNPAATNATSNQSPYGFALVGGNQLPGLGRTTNVADPTGLTFTSDQAVYIQGDYNTPSIGSGVNAVSGNKQPAAVLADTLNVLSNSCSDLNNQISKTVQNATNCTTAGTPTGTNVNPSNTTIYTAVLAGNDVTVLGGAYNGGLENYPRLHENWSGRTFSFRGSFVSLFTPDRNNGQWPGTGSQSYNAPTRNWDYDTDFNDASNLPPLDPRFVYLKQETFIRNFQE